MNRAEAESKLRANQQAVYEKYRSGQSLTRFERSLTASAEVVGDDRSATIVVLLGASGVRPLLWNRENSEAFDNPQSEEVEL